jgi:drug/metabolite transporter (DMT)-like permease
MFAHFNSWERVAKKDSLFCIDFVESIKSVTCCSMLGIIQTLFCAAGFGVMGTLGTLAYREGVSLQTLMMWRFGLATIMLLFWCHLSKSFHLNNKKEFILGILMGLLGFAGLALLYFSAMRYINTGVAAIILYTNPVIVALLGWYLDRQKLNFQTLLALIFVSLDALWSKQGGRITTLGIILSIASAIWYACYIKTSERVVRTITPATTATLVCAGAFISFLIATIISGAPLTPATPIGWFAAAGLVFFSTAIAIIFMMLGISKLGQQNFQLYDS